MKLDTPHVNALVRVDVREGASGLPSRVEDVEDGDLCIAAPAYEGDVEPPRATDRMVLHWTGVRGVHALPASFVELQRQGAGRLPRWRVRPVGNVELVQRRRFVRSPVSDAVAVVPVEGQLARVVAGSLVDLGEGGIRARFDALSPLAEATEVQVHLSLRDRSVILVGTVLRCLPIVVDGARGHEAVIVFEPTEQEGDLIRREVLHQQVLRRRQAAT